MEKTVKCYKKLFFLVYATGVQDSQFLYPKALPGLSLRVLPSTILLYDCHLHVLEVGHIVSWQSKVLTDRDIRFDIHITSVSVEASVELLLGFANILETTYSTFKQVNDVSALAINPTKDFVCFASGLAVEC